jgi:uncharacterized protein (TIGR02646 family)
MRKLDRASSTPPVCLGTYSHITHTWDTFTGACKRELRAALVQMQGIPGVTTADANEYGLRCAYCEGAIHNAGHIEHFRRKNRQHYPILTFSWANLFLSCGDQEHCGHFKDRKSAPPYNPNQLVKPDVDDPDDFLYFHSSGEVRKKEGLNDGDALRASETIRVFGLDDRTLVGKRAKVLSVYKQRIIDDIDELATWVPEDREAYLAGELGTVRDEPYSTTLRHFLTKQI